MLQHGYTKVQASAVLACCVHAVHHHAHVSLSHLHLPLVSLPTSFLSPSPFPLSLSSISTPPLPPFSPSFPPPSFPTPSPPSLPPFLVILCVCLCNYMHMCGTLHHTYNHVCPLPGVGGIVELEGDDVGSGIELDGEPNSLHCSVKKNS